MAVEIKINDRTAWVHLVKQNGNLLEIEVDGKNYQVDLMHTADGTFSIIESGRSYNIELVPHNQPKKYTAHTLYNTYELEVIDAEARYLINRSTNGSASTEKTIISPMPGKVVKVLVNEGDVIRKGETAIIIAAMKMESEYKAPADGIVKRVYVKDGDTLEGNQMLIEIE
ncbi:MAG TPA: acetyl-CoA carboxylase biotin carboxyl carrier protein subunit [Mariniphaga anaerophila]|uniref:Acetyl-CoA carboxylase biotin carboxyl carrier protein subunit n=1 Tax=Mariniphaga anaerophila TaxID=1484053 RepID=A0A831PJ43_9BACT|nr:acetyl-CoA carboxylase biotin carboxyl carrier protein subunit [Mariniphaga anaerophila]